MSVLREFCGFGGYTRQPAGYMSWQHLVFVSSLMAVMIFCAVFFGLKNKHKDENAKNKALVIAAISIDLFELLKIVLLSFRGNDPLHFLYDLPLFLCSIQLITIPLAAFSKGRVKAASLDFVTIFGILGAVMGTYFAGQNYACYPVLSFDNVVSGITHSISGFASLYIMISGMASMNKKNVPITLTILGSFCVGAYVANIFTNANYMFLLRGDGTPYDIFYNLVNGNAVLYPLIVVALFVLYIMLFYFTYYRIAHKKEKK